MVDYLRCNNTSERKKPPTNKYYCFETKLKSPGLMRKQLKGLMASHVVVFFLFQYCYLCLIKMVNYLSSDNTSEIKEPSQLNIIFSK